MSVGNGKDWEDQIEEEEDLPEHDDDEEQSDEEKSEEEDGDDDVEDGDGDEEGSEDGDEDGEESEDDDESKSKKGKGDKKDSKIIALKRQVKDAQKRIAELENGSDEQEIEKQVKAKRQKLIDAGYSEDEDLDEVLEVFKENIRMKLQNERKEWDSLSKQYPSITKYKTEILELKGKMPQASIEDIYLAKFYKESEYDKKTRIEQETRYKAKKAQEKGKSGLTGSSKNDKPVKLSPSDERAYQIAKKYNSALTRKQFLKDIDEEEELT